MCVSYEDLTKATSFYGDWVTSDLTSEAKIAQLKIQTSEKDFSSTIEQL